MNTPTPARDVEQRLRAAMAARVDLITSEQLRPAVAPVREPRPWRGRSGLLAAAVTVAVGAAGVYAYGLAGGEGQDLDVVGPAADGPRLAGVTYELPAEWDAVEQQAPPRLRRACLQPAGAGAAEGCGAVELLVADPVPDAGEGGAIRVEYLGVEDCAAGATKMWNIEKTTIDGAAAHSNTFRCEAEDELRVFWTLDGFNVALLVNDPRWEQTAATIVASLRISPDLRRSSLGMHYVEATPYDPAGPSSPVPANTTMIETPGSP